MLMKVFSLVLALLLSPLLPAYAETGAVENVKVKEIRTEIGANAVAYPQLEGMADEQRQKRINDDIVLSSNITSHLITLSALADSAWGLQVGYESFLSDGIFSTVLSAQGKMPTGRKGHIYTVLSYDLTTGGRLTLADLFSDAQGAMERMEEIALETLTDELSGYMEHSDMLPLPVEAFTVNRDGVTFYYPSNQFSLLSGYSGACQFYFEELKPFLRTDEEGVPARIGALPQAHSDEEARALIKQSVEAGSLPHVPVKLEDAMSGVVEKYRLIRTPDEFPGGRYFVLEAPEFRQVLLISDAIESGYERSTVEGIQIKRGELFGLEIDGANQTQWRALLGEPDETIAFTEGMGYDYNLPVGESDVYHYGANELRLHADLDGILRSIQISK